MNVKIVVSKVDPVGKTVLKLGLPVDLIVDEDVVDFNVEVQEPLVVFSRHESSAKVHSVTVHTPGNPGDSAMGGKPRTLGIAYPRLLRAIYLEISRLPVNLEKTFEATHHGPTEITAPVTFVEIGSDESHWTDEGLVRAVYEAIIKGIRSFDAVTCDEVVTVFGGPHYSKTANRLAQSGSCIAHVISKHYLTSLDDNVIMQAVTKSINVVTKVVFDNVNKSIRDRVAKALSNIPLKLESL